MIRINLLPEEMHASERKIDPGIIVAGVGGFLIVILTPIYLMQYSRRNNLRTETTSLQSQLERYKPIVAQVEALEQAKAQLEQRKTIIKTLENERLRYPYFMEDLLKLLPSNIWITNLTTTMPTDGSIINVGVDVTALDHYAVADIVSNLETSQIFSEIELGPITLSQTATGQSISFRVTTTYKKDMGAMNAAQKS